MCTPPAESFENEEEAGKAAGKSIWSEPGCHCFLFCLFVFFVCLFFPFPWIIAMLSTLRVSKKSSNKVTAC